jgi:DNA-binding NarL/FixJ family response regulator
MFQIAGVETRMRVLVADRDMRVRSALQSLNAALDIEIIGEASDLRQLIDLTADNAPDMILLDLSLPGLVTDTHIPFLRFFGLGSKIIALSSNRSDCMMALSVGADYFVYKGDVATPLVSLMETLCRQFI